jgi:hypothetical protein
MKTIFASCSAAFLLLAAIQSRAGILAGPITNPANGHDYYLLTPNTWSASETEAETLGGTLVVIRNAAELEWICSKVGWFDGTHRGFWIGLHRDWNGAPLHWVTDAPMDYSNWLDGQPDNAGGNESAVHVRGGDDKLGTTWNDLAENNSLCSVVEVPGKSNPKSFSEKEKSLVGTWYDNGDPERPCWIARADNLIFFIDQNKDASRAIYTPEGFLFSPKWKQHAEIVGDKILWSKGNWWSRKPSEYKAGETSSDAKLPKHSSGSLTD